MFQARRQVLLTGAGFSKDFGGYLATEMWSVIFSQPEIEQHSGLRKHLLNQLNYELAYSEVMHSDRFDEDVRKDFTIAVGRSYQQMHEAFYVSGIRIPAIGLCKAIVGAFAGTGANERGFVFTLNQDLLMERFFTNGSHSRFDLWIPGIDNFGCFNYTLPRIQTADYKYVLPGRGEVQKLQSNFWNDTAYGRFVYLKLHGSYWWKSSDGSNAMVIGSEKTGLIDHEPYLKWSHSIFEQVLSGPGCDLVVIGYGFGDQHINKVIADSISEHGLKLYVVSPERPEEFRNKLIPVHGTLPGPLAGCQDGTKLWEGMHGYYCCRVTDLYTGNNGDLTPLGKSLLERVGV